MSYNEYFEDLYNTQAEAQGIVSTRDPETKKIIKTPVKVADLIGRFRAVSLGEKYYHEKWAKFEQAVFLCAYESLPNIDLLLIEGKKYNVRAVYNVANENEFLRFFLWL